MNQIWFLELLGGYLVKVWVAPLLLFLLLLIKKMMTRQLSINKIDFILIAYAIFGFIAMLLNETLYFAIKYYLIMIAPICFYFVIVEQIKDNRDVELMVKILFFGCVILSIYTYVVGLQYMKDPSTVTREIVTSAGNLIEGSEARFEVEGVTYSRGLLGMESSKYCGLLAPAILLGIMFFFQSNSKVKYFYFGLSVFMLYVTLATLSRTGIMTTLVGIVVLVWTLYRNEKSIRSKLVLFACLFLFMFSFYIYKFQPNSFLRFLQLFSIFEIDFINDYLHQYGLYSYSVRPEGNYDVHLLSILKSFNTFLSNPFFGKGYSYTEGIVGEHNRYLFILVSSGLLTFIPYVVFLFMLTIIAGRTLRSYGGSKSMQYNYGYLFYACNIMFLVKLMNEGMETFYYWILFSLAAAWTRNCKREQVLKGYVHAKT